MQTILRVNGATMVQVGDLYRIVPINTVSQLPLDPVMNADPKTLPEDERMVINLIFLKYATPRRWTSCSLRSTAKAPATRSTTLETC